MVSRQRVIIKWMFYAALALLALLVQTSVVGNFRVAGVRFSVLPVAAACVALREGRDNGAIFGLLCGLFWGCSSTRYAAFYILMLPISCMLCGLICDFWMRRGLITGILLSFGCLVLCEGSVCAFLIATSALPMLAISQVLLPSCLISLLFVPLFHGCAGAVARLGGNYGA